jgi:two-component system CheB/CheR fusion protein
MIPHTGSASPGSAAKPPADAKHKQQSSAQPDEGPNDHLTDGHCVVVGIGASAGGLDAFKRLLATLPDDAGMAYVLVQHLDPQHESLMAELLARHTAMPIVEVEETLVIEPDTVYMIPPGRFIRIAGGALFLDDPVRKRGLRLPIDYFFSSLARARQQRGVGIVLTGTGSDGAEGLREIKAEGGMTIAQQPDEAQFDGMPTAAIATGVVDRVLRIDAIADAISAYGQHPYVQRRPDAEGLLPAAAPDHFRAILDLLKAETDRDFSRYKPSTLARRIERRMGIRHVKDAAEYLRLLRSDDIEVRALFRDLLIGVTRFFRDPDAWQELDRALTARLRDKRNDETVRVWVPGCATGEEAYSIAMQLFDLQQRLERRWDLQIFATDIDAEAIEAARAGSYPETIAKDIADERLRAYFDRDAKSDRLRVRKRLRETCIFAVQSLLADAPFSSLDLISCRNLLIYLEPDVQQRALDMFHFGLKEDGLLFLGNSEAPKKRSTLFKTLSHPARLYQKLNIAKGARGSFPIVPNLAGDHRDDRDRTDAVNADGAGELPAGTVERSKKALLEEFAPASVVINQRGLIQYIHGPVRNYLDFPSGEPDLDLAQMALDGLKAKTRTAMHQARASRETVSVVAARFVRHGKEVSVRVRVQPLPGQRDRDEQLYLVSFLDEPAAADVASGAQAGGPPESGDRARQLALELEATREDLQSTIEALESANEELKASNEEVMSMNEELQSANEELETSREELQSLNEELSTVNNQLSGKVSELEATTNDLSNLLASTETATLFLDAELCIRRFTPATMRLMSLRESDIGRPLSDLASRVDDPDLPDDVAAVLDSLRPVEKEVSLGPEEWYLRRITPFRTADNKIEGVVVTYADVSPVMRAANQLERREQQQAAVAQLGEAALAGQSPQALCERAVQSIAVTLDIELVKVLRLLPGGRELRVIAGVGWDEGVVGQVTVPAGIDSQAGFTLQTTGPVISRDLRREKRFRPVALLQDHGVVSGMSIVIGPEASPWGVLGAHTRCEREFTVDDSHFILAVANILWEAIRREDVETALRDSEARMGAFLNNSAVLAWLKDDAGRYVYLSRTYEQRFAIRAEDWHGKTDDDMWPPETAAALRENDRRVLDGGETVEAIERVTGTSDEPWYFLVSKFPFTDAEGRRYVGGLGVDVTERMRAEAALARSEERLREAARMAKFGTYYGYADTGKLHWSAEFKALLGRPPDAPVEAGIGQVPDFVYEEDRARLHATIAASLDPAGDGSFQSEHRIVRSDGEVRWLLMQGCTEFDGDGPERRPRRIAGTALDITERHAYEEQLREAQARAEAASEAKSQFLANMSHEIRTPLTAILGFADVLATRLTDHDDLACIQTIKQNGAHLRQILDDFLDLAKIESGRLTPAVEVFDAIAIVGEIRSLFEARAQEKGLFLSVEARGPLPVRIHSDPKLLRQILLNLVGNAVKFTEQGGVRILVHCDAEQERLVLEVVDTGIGIDPGRLEDVFVAFEQLEGTGAGGTGLGLSITRKLVAVLGGDISVRSEVGVGSTFRVELPTGQLNGVEWVEREALDPAGIDCSDASGPAVKISGRVLVVDDHRDIRFLVQELVEGAGGEVSTAADGQQGIDQWRRAREQNREPDVILMDLRMPGMDGIETARRLRDAGCQASIVALTANAMPRERDRCLEIGCDGFLSKPIDQTELLQTLARRIGQSATGGDEQGLRILCVDDNLDTCSAQKMLLDHYGHRVSIASSGSAALAAVEQEPPQVALIDLGLEDMSGLDLVAELRRRPALAHCVFLCVSGREVDDVQWQTAGFHRFLQKPVQTPELLELLNELPLAHADDNDRSA